MQEEEVWFFGEGHRIHGRLFQSEQPLPGLPVLVICSGYQGLCDFYPKMFARALTARGFSCMGFDYRGFAESEGPPGRVVLEEQVEDIRSAVWFLRGRAEAGGRSIGLVGWGMGAANSILAAARDRDIAAVAALNGFYNGRRWLGSRLPAAEWEKLPAVLAEDRRERARTGISRQTDPFLYYPLDGQTGSYVQQHLAPLRGFGARPTLELTESILELDAEGEARKLDECPLFIAHGERNILHPVEEASSLHRAVRGSVLRLLPGAHNDFMLEDHPLFLSLVEDLERFFRRSAALQ